MLGKFTLSIGLVLLATFVIYMVSTVLRMKKSVTDVGTLSTEAELEAASGEDYTVESEEAGTKDSLLKDMVLLVVGAAVIAIGASLLNNNAQELARMCGISEKVIGLTIVALGTSLPELVTAITALAKGHGSLSLGNIIGANLFNLVLVSGTAITISPFDLPVSGTIAGINSSLVLDIPVMLGVMLIMVAPTMIKQKLSRWQGILLLGIYLAYTVALFVM